MLKPNVFFVGIVHLSPNLPPSVRGGSGRGGNVEWSVKSGVIIGTILKTPHEIGSFHMLLR